jgi:hypothetical protein
MPPQSDSAALDIATIGRGLTPREVGRLLRMSPDRVRALIVRGEMQAVNISVRRGVRRFVVLPEQLRAWIEAHQAATEPPPAPRRPRRQPQDHDFYP